MKIRLNVFENGDFKRTNGKVHIYVSDHSISINTLDHLKSQLKDLFKYNSLDTVHIYTEKGALIINTDQLFHNDVLFIGRNNEKFKNWINVLKDQEELSKLLMEEEQQQDVKENESIKEIDTQEQQEINNEEDQEENQIKVSFTMWFDSLDGCKKEIGKEFMISKEKGMNVKNLIQLLLNQLNCVYEDDCIFVYKAKEIKEFDKNILDIMDMSDVENEEMKVFVLVKGLKIILKNLLNGKVHVVTSMKKDSFVRDLKQYAMDHGISHSHNLNNVVLLKDGRKMEDGKVLLDYGIYYGNIIFVSS